MSLRTAGLTHDDFNKFTFAECYLRYCIMIEGYRENAD